MEKNLKKISVPLPDTYISNIDKLIEVSNKYSVNSKIYSTRAQWLRDAIQEKYTKDIGYINNNLKKPDQLSEAIDDINRNLK